MVVGVFRGGGDLSADDLRVQTAGDAHGRAHPKFINLHAIGNARDSRRGGLEAIALVCAVLGAGRVLVDVRRSQHRHGFVARHHSVEHAPRGVLDFGRAVGRDLVDRNHIDRDIALALAGALHDLLAVFVKRAIFEFLNLLLAEGVHRDALEQLHDLKAR